MKLKHIEFDLQRKLWRYPGDGDNKWRPMATSGTPLTDTMVAALGPNMTSELCRELEVQLYDAQRQISWQ